MIEGLRLTYAACVNFGRRELPPCDVEHLQELLMLLKATHPTVRSKTLRDLVANVRCLFVLVCVGYTYMVVVIEW
jgi:hypothetical protein